MIRINQLRKEFAVKDGVFTALPSIDLNVEKGEFFVLLGPSGSGKSTLLRCVAGIDTPQGGEIYLADRLIYSGAKNVFVRPEDRGLGMVFQSYAVWPHMTVYQNVALPLTHGAKRVPKDKVRDRVMYALSLVQMDRYADRPVPHLSGGQQQRVALARSLAVEPVVLLMDEPLSNLEARLREEVRHQILTVTKMVGVTVLYVTHDQSEALALGDKIAVMDAGRIIQLGTPTQLFSMPATPMVAEFLGQVNWLKGQVASAGVIDTPVGRVLADTRDLTGGVQLGIRPSSIELMPVATGAANEFPGEIIEEIFLGEQIQLRIRMAEDVVFEVRAQKPFRGRHHAKNVFCQMEAAEMLVYAAH